MSDHRLEWGVKDTFRRYVASVPDGICEISEEVTLTGSGRYAFPLAEVVGSPVECFRFEGGLLFSAHGGFMRVPIVDPWLHRAGSEGTLSVASGSEPTGRVEIASGSLAEADPVAERLQFNLQLTSGGLALFGDNYTAGAELDPLIIAAPASAISDLAAAFASTTTATSTSNRRKRHEV